MDSHFVNYDARSVHDMIDELLAMSGDPEAIRRLQESINAVDQRAQSSISVVNAALEKLGTEVDAVANAGAKNILDVSRASSATLVVDSVTEDGAITFKSTHVVGNNQCIAKATLKKDVTYRIVSDIAPAYGRIAAGVNATNMPTASGGYAPDITMISGGQSNVYLLQHRNSIKESVFRANSDQDVYFWFAPDEGTPEEFTMRIMVCENDITDNTYVPYGKTNAELTADTGWLLLENSENQHMTNGIYYRKKSGVVYVDIGGEVDVALGANLNVTVGTLPTGFRPTRPAYRELIELNGSLCLCAIFADGKIVFVSFSGAPINSVARGNISYPV